jgi:hypothetical protein
MSGELESTTEAVVMAYFLYWHLIAATLQNYKCPIAAKLKASNFRIQVMRYYLSQLVQLVSLLKSLYNSIQIRNIFVSVFYTLSFSVSRFSSVITQISVII